MGSGGSATWVAQSCLCSAGVAEVVEESVRWAVVVVVVVSQHASISDKGTMARVDTASALGEGDEGGGVIIIVAVSAVELRCVWW